MRDGDDRGLRDALARPQRQARARTTASSSAAATTSTTSSCPGCCTWRSCAARSPTPRSPRSTRRRRRSIPGVVAVVTGELLAQHNLAWMPTLSGDTQAVLATDKVRMQGQEVACVIAEDVYTAHDALELIEVDYEPLPAGHDAAGRPRTRRAADPRRQGGADRQQRLPLGGRATPRAPSARSRRRTASSASRRSTRARTRRRSSAAAASRTSTRRPARRRST